MKEVVLSGVVALIIIYILWSVLYYAFNGLEFDEWSYSIWNKLSIIGVCMALFLAFLLIWLTIYSGITEV